VEALGQQEEGGYRAAVRRRQYALPKSLGETMSESGSGDIEQRIARLEQQDVRLTRALERLAEREVAPAVKARRNWDAYAAMIASFIGVLAVAIGGYTAYVQRQQLRAEVWPHLQLWRSDVNVGYYVTNQGTGPARITRVRVKVDGVPLRTWSAVTKAAGLGNDVATSSLKQRVLPAGKDFTILQPMDDEDSRDKLRALWHSGPHAVSATICYCSVLEECWTESEDATADAGDGCPILAIEQFDN
jgi:hypothetical protein